MSSSEKRDDLTDDSDPTATWSRLPRKGQLAIVLYARFTEPLAQTAFSSYMYYQLESFDNGLPEKEIAIQAGCLSAAFAIGSCATSVFWGYLAESPAIGRKLVIVAGLLIAIISCLGAAFSTHFYQVLIFQMIGGIASGNVGVIRTSIAEIITIKSFHSRAFSLLPLCTTFGSITGPLVASFLLGSADDYSKLCRPRTSSQCSWTERWPFALPMIFNAILVMLAALFAVFGLEETLPSQRMSLALQGRGRRLRRYFSMILGGKKSSHSYNLLPSDTDNDSDQMSLDNEKHGRPTEEHIGTRYSKNSSDIADQERLWEKPPCPSTSAIAWKVIAKLVMSLHFTAYATAIAVFLPAPLDEGIEGTGGANQGHGLGFSVQQIGALTTTVTLLGIPTQLLLFPRLHDMAGSLRCLQLFLPLSTGSYLGFMLLSQPPESRVLRSALAAILLVLHVICRTICQPSALLLINDASEDQEARAKVHSITHACDSAISAVGLVLGGVLIRAGIQAHFPGLAWLVIASISALNSVHLRYSIV